MTVSARHFLITAAAGVGAAVALLSAPSAAAQPAGGASPTNCLLGTHGQSVYCDGDVTADGSWVRCAQAMPEQATLFGGVTGYLPQGLGDCRRVTPGAVPAGSPPYHIGYGGEAAGRV